MSFTSSGNGWEISLERIFPSDPLWFPQAVLLHVIIPFPWTLHCNKSNLRTFGTQSQYISFLIFRFGSSQPFWVLVGCQDNAKSTSAMVSFPYPVSFSSCWVGRYRGLSNALTPHMWSGRVEVHPSKSLDFLPFALPIARMWTARKFSKVLDRKYRPWVTSQFRENCVIAVNWHSYVQSFWEGLLRETGTL